MNEVIAAVPVAASVMWLLRPRPAVRRIGDDSSTTPTEPTRRPVGRLAGRRTPAAEPIALAHWCEGVARRLRGGDALRVALDHHPDDEAILPTIETIRRRTADPARATPLPPDAALVAAVVSACLEQGGPAAEPLDRAAGVLRARAAERDERRVQSAQARLSALVLTWLPVAVLVLLVATSGAVRGVVSTPFGIAIVVAGGLLNLAGWWWMRRIVDRAAR